MDNQEVKRILIIDDDVDFCHLMTRILGMYGFETDCAYTLEESVTKFIEKPDPDIILLDYGMPGGTGLSFFQQHRELFDDHEVILISADPSEVLGKQVAQAGIVHFFPKPVALSTLLRVIRQSA